MEYSGGITVIFGTLFLFLCPENPQTCKVLNAHEKRVALERVRTNRSSLGSKIIKWYQVKEALCPWICPQGWSYFFIVMSLSLPNGGIGNFLHLIVGISFCPLSILILIIEYSFNHTDTPLSRPSLWVSPKLPCRLSSPSLALSSLERSPTPDSTSSWRTCSPVWLVLSSSIRRVTAVLFVSPFLRSSCHQIVRKLIRSNFHSVWLLHPWIICRFPRYLLRCPGRQCRRIHQTSRRGCHGLHCLRPR